MSPRGAGPATRLVTATPVPYAPDAYERGVRLVLSPVRKAPPEVLDPRIKSLNYLPHVLARADAEARDADDALLLNVRGDVCEATTANLFLVRDGRILTPALSSGCLDGITRSDVLHVARAGGFTVEETSFRPEALADADEAFLTASLAEVLPVLAFEGHPIGNGRPGAVTRRIHRLYRKHALQP